MKDNDMNTLDLDVIENDTDFCAAAVVQGWMKNLPSESEEDYNRFSLFLYTTLWPFVFDILCSDTPMSYQDVKSLIVQQGVKDLEPPFTAVTDKEYKKCIEVRMHVAKSQVMSGASRSPWSLQDEKRLQMKGEVERLSHQVVGNWLEGTHPHWEKEIYTHVLDKVTRFWAKSSVVEAEDILYWFDYYMTPSANTQERKQWNKQQFLHDIDVTLCVFDYKIQAENEKIPPVDLAFAERVLTRRHRKDSATAPTERLTY